MCQFNMMKELPALGYLYNNVCINVTCAGMPVAELQCLSVCIKKGYALKSSACATLSNSII